MFDTEVKKVSVHAVMGRWTSYKYWTTEKKRKKNILVNLSVCIYVRCIKPSSLVKLLVFTKNWTRLQLWENQQSKLSENRKDMDTNGQLIIYRDKLLSDNNKIQTILQLICIFIDWFSDLVPYSVLLFFLFSDNLDAWFLPRVSL